MYNDMVCVKRLNSFKKLYPLTLESGAQIFSEFRTLEEYNRDKQSRVITSHKVKYEMRNQRFSAAIKAALDKLDPRKQPIFRRA